MDDDKWFSATVYFRSAVELGLGSPRLNVASERVRVVPGWVAIELPSGQMPQTDSAVRHVPADLVSSVVEAAAP
jgi:hypothetical protein